MNASNAKDFLPLVQALAEGRVIQFNSRHAGWTDTDWIYSEQPVERYRIKPEPREVWVNHYTDSRFDTGPYNSERQARILANSGATQVRYREVIE